MIFLRLKTQPVISRKGSIFVMFKTGFLIHFAVLFIFCFANTLEADDELKSALVVIDVQKAFSDPEGFSPVCRDQADAILPVINNLSQKFLNKNKDIIYIKQDYVRDTQFDNRLKIRSKLHFVKNEPNSFSNKEFEYYLVDNNIKHLYFVGLAAE